MEEVNSPKHYQGQGMEAIDVIDAFELGFNLGNVVKYVLRAGKKGSYINATINDLNKAKWYLNRELLKLGGSYEKDGSEASPQTIYGYDWCKGGQCQEPLAPI